MLILLLPLTTIIVALVGFYVWHRQLVRKRHFEVADTALCAFRRAQAAIAHAREPTAGPNEGISRKRGDHELAAYSGMLDRLYIPLERLQQRNDAFVGLERAAVDVEVHFGSELADRVRQPLQAYRHIAVATACRMANVGLSTPAKASPALVSRWEAVVYCGARKEPTPDDADLLSRDMDDASRAIEAALRPYVEAPTFREFLAVGKVKTKIYRALGRLLRYTQRKGYGKIAVYAQLPPN